MNDMDLFTEEAAMQQAANALDSMPHAGACDYWLNEACQKEQPCTCGRDEALRLLLELGVKAIAA